MRFLIQIGLVSLLAMFCFSCASSSDDDDSESPNADDDDAGGVDDDADDDAADDDDTWAPLPPPEDALGPTKYPIVLAHGFMGWGYLGPLSNFYLVADTYAAFGYDVFEPWVSSINSMEVRANQLANKIDARYPGQKINIIAHSQGGLDARYLISTLGWGDRVACLVTLSTPHQGASIADFATGLLPDVAEDAADAVLELLGMDWDGVTQVTRPYVRDVFNPANPDDERVKYFSFHGNGEEIFAPLQITHAIIESMEGCNDGIIGCESATYGENLGELPTDHFGIVGHPLGFIDFPFMDFYLDLAVFLRESGC